MVRIVPISPLKDISKRHRHIPILHIVPILILALVPIPNTLPSAARRYKVDVQRVVDLLVGVAIVRALPDDLAGFVSALGDECRDGRLRRALVFVVAVV